MTKLKLTKTEQKVLWYIYAIGFWVTTICGTITALIGICVPQVSLTAMGFVALDLLIAVLAHHAITMIEEAEIIEN